MRTSVRELAALQRLRIEREHRRPVGLLLSGRGEHGVPDAIGRRILV